MNKIKTPPMGWNSWDCYGAGVTEEIVKKNADYIAEYLKPYGWEYVVVDIQWSAPNAYTHAYDPFTELCMDEYSRLIPAEKRFPSAAGGKGFAPLGEYIHALGLKFGIHIMRGIPRQAVHRNTKILGSEHTARQIAKTASICQWNTDMYGVDPEKDGAREYYESLFALYSQWGVDFIKIDDICREMPHEKAELELISDCIRNCGRDMVFSLSPGPAVLEESETYKQTADMWRITDDFWDVWELLYNMFERCEKWSIHSGAGHWPDADMLPVGAIDQDRDINSWTKFTEDEQITMMNLWCVFRSPLIIGGDMTKNDDFTLKLLSNPDVIAMNKNARHSHQVWRRKADGTEMVLWTAVCSEGGQYAAIFNIGEEKCDITVPLTDLEIYSAVNGKDLWTKEERAFDNEITVSLAPHASAAFLLK
ncbi:MAG: glycoside hydrolase family 27 protein [Clostridia bacterium]|nr:glycoside hydrolase family 27 protein [Clostridia bacterium]